MQKLTFKCNCMQIGQQLRSLEHGYVVRLGQVRTSHVRLQGVIGILYRVFSNDPAIFFVLIQYTRKRNKIQMDICPELRFFLPSHHINHRGMCISKRIKTFSSVYFQKSGGHKTACLDNCLKVLKIILTRSFFFISKSAGNGNAETNTSFHEVRYQTADISMLKAVKTQQHRVKKTVFKLVFFTL